jgi:hypothetical protein
VSGFHFDAVSAPVTLPKIPGDHQALPVADSWYEEGTLHPANLKAVASYPVIAVCKKCHERIRLAVKTQMEWVHVSSVEPEATAG